MNPRELRRELRKASANELELERLVSLAEKLDTVSPPGLTLAAKQRIANRLPVEVELVDTPCHKHLFSWRWMTVSSVGALATISLIVSTLAPGMMNDPELHDVKHDEQTQQTAPKVDTMPEAPKAKEKPLAEPEKQPEAPEQPSTSTPAPSHDTQPSTKKPELKSGVKNWWQPYIDTWESNTQTFWKNNR